MNKINHSLNIDIKALDSQFIGSKWVKSQKSDFPVISPSTEQTIAKVSLPTIEDADHAIKLARKTFDNGSWSKLPIKDRIEVCDRLCRAMEN